MTGPRYAIYAAPPADHPLTAMAAAWLGRDPADTGEEVPPPPALPLLPPDHLPHDLAALTEAPRRYGFHGTLKAPFHLGPGIEADALRAALAGFARNRAAPPPVPLVVENLGPFLALVPATPAPELDALAAAVVEAFDSLRAPLAAADTARRRAAGLTAKQDSLLHRWGYPFVFDEFRFHMTLTGPVPDPSLRRALVTALADHFSPALAKPLVFEDLVLFTQPDRQAPFVIDSRHRFGK